MRAPLLSAFENENSDAFLYINTRPILSHEGTVVSEKERMASSFPLLNSSTKKTVLVDTGKGLDQLGNEIGMPRPGDVVKCHMKASYLAPRPWLLGVFGKKKTLRKKEFLDTGRIGTTCFYEVTIPNITTTTKTKEHPATAQDIITGWIQTMTLGEVAKFVLDLKELPEHDCPNIKSMFVTKQQSSSSKLQLLHRSQHAHVPENIQQMTFQISSFRIIRNRKEHRRKDQNGRGGKMWGSFTMGP